MTKETLLVLGATGRVGRSVLEALATREVSVRAATRDPAAAHTTHPNVTWVRLDLEQPETFAPALRAVTRVFMIARPGDDHADRVAAPFITAMQSSGVSHVVSLTAMGTELRPDSALHRLERQVELSGIDFTHLRPGFFFQLVTSPPLSLSILQRGELRVPAADAALSFIDARDVGEVAASVLVDPGHTGRAYTLTGPAAISHGELVEALAFASARSLRYVAIDEPEAQRELAGAGLPEAWIARVLAFYRLVRAGHASLVTDCVPRILGRPARDLSAFARDYAHIFAARRP